MSEGFFFSNPTSEHFPPASANGGDEERRGAVGIGCGASPEQIVNKGFNAAAPFNAGVAGNSHQQQQQMINNIQVRHGGVSNPLANLNGVGNGGNAGFVNNPLQNASAMSGLGSFFFNPLALFTTKNNNGNLGALSNAPNVNNSMAAATNANVAPAANVLAANFLSANAPLNGGCAASAMLNGNNLANNTPVAKSNANQLLTGNMASNGLGIQQNQLQQASPSPVPLAFMTPLMTPNPTPPPPSRNDGRSSSTPSEMFLDANSFPPSENASVVTAGGECNNSIHNAVAASVGNQALKESHTSDDIPQYVGQQQQYQQQQQQQQPQEQREQVGASSPPVNTTSQGLLQRSISSMGSALAGVAAYVNQSFLSGIPFHIADRAMKESKTIYAKWWEDGINDNVDEEGNKRKGKDEEYVDDGDGDDAEGSRRQGKRRRLDSLGSSCSGSALSKSLKRHYDDMGVDTSGSVIDYRLAQPPQPPTSQSEPPKIEVDSSIIAPRRRNQRDKSSAAAASSSTSSLFAQQPGGYNAFNNIGEMYDFDGNDGQLREEQNLPGGGGGGADYGGIDSMYNSLGGYYTTNEDPKENSIDCNNDDDLAGAAAANDSASSPVEGNAHATAINPLSNDEERSPTPLLNGTMNAIQALLEEKNRASEEKEMLQMISSPREWVKKSVRSELIDALQAVQGDVADKRFLSSLEVLGNFYKTSGRDARVSPWSSACKRPNASETGVGSGYGGDDACGYGGNYDEEMGGPTASDLLEGCWVNMSRPNYVECLGQNSDNDFLYTLGRMSFDMFRPGNLVCSVQSTHNTIKIVGEREELPAFVPKSLREEVASLCDSALVGGGATRRPLLRSYDIAVSLTIEPPELVGQPNPSATPTQTKRLRAVQSVKGYVLPDPEIPNRLTVWFTGGKLSPARLPSDGDEEDTVDEDQPEYGQNEEEYGDFFHWKAMFAKGKWRKTLGERARAMAAKLLLGADVPNKMEEDGHMEYILHRPVGGHGKVYVDVLYLDEDILIMRGHHGTIYAMARSNVSQKYRAMRGNQYSGSDD